MPTRRKSSSVPSTGLAAGQPPRSVPRPVVFVVVGLAIVSAVLCAIYFWDHSGGAAYNDRSRDLVAPNPDQPALVLPTASLTISVEQLRLESEDEVAGLMARYPKSPVALHIAARHYAELQQYAKAAEIWKRCIDLAPIYAGPRAGLARAAMERGDDAEAVEILQAALEAGCRTPEIYNQLATALQQMTQLDEAEQVSLQSVTAFPQDADLWLTLGQIQLQLEKLTDARASLNEAIRLRPDSTTAHFALATIDTRLGQLEQAEEQRRRFSELKSRHPLAEQRFQDVYEAVLRSLVATTFCSAAGEYETQHEPQEAERLYRRALEMSPANADTCRSLADFYHRQGRSADALAVQRRLVALEPGRVENFLNLASLSAQLGDNDAAERALLSAIRAQPDNAAVIRSLAGFYLRRGQNENAREFAEQATRLEPSAEAYLILATACRQLGDGAAAETALRAARRLAPNDPRVQNFAP